MIAAGALALLSACGQKGPLYMPANAGPAASTRHGGDNMPLTPVPPVQSASSPGVLSGVVPAR